MRRFLLGCAGFVLGLAAYPILWNGPDLYLYEDSQPLVFTRMVGLGILVEGVLAALGAALCLGRAIVPLTSATAGGGPVLPLSGLLFLLAAAGPFEQARKDAEGVEAVASKPELFGGERGAAELLAQTRRHERTARAFCVLWLVAGVALLGTSLYLRPRVWKLSWPLNGVGCGVTLGGFMLSGLSGFVYVAEGALSALGGKGAHKDTIHAACLGMLAGAFVAVVGSILAVRGKTKPRQPG